MMVVTVGVEYLHTTRSTSTVGRLLKQLMLTLTECLVTENSVHNTS